MSRVRVFVFPAEIGENKRSPTGALTPAGPLDPRIQLPEGGPSVSIVKPPGAESKWSVPREGR